MEEILDDLSSLLHRCFSIFQRQFVRSWNELDSRQLFRIAAIIGGYLLIRPIIVKFFEKGHKSAMAKEDEKKKKKKKSKTVPAIAKKISPNTLRYGHLKGLVDVSDDTDSESEEAKKPATEEEKQDQKVRRRQRRVLRAKLDEDEAQQLVEEEWDDPDLTDLFPPPPTKR